MTRAIQRHELQRANDFMEWQANVGRVLRETQIEDALGELGAQLIQLNETAFLPQVTWFEVSLPAEQQGTDNVAILPLYIRDRNSLVPDDSFIHPTKSGRQHISSQLHNADKGASPSDVDECIERAFDQIGFQERKDYLSAEDAATKMLHASDNGIYIAGRPMVAVNMPSFSEKHPIIRAMSGAHELVHALDFGLPFRSVEEQEDFQGTSEFRGYHAAHLIGQWAVEAGLITADQLAEQDPITPKVEEWRQEYGFGSAELLNGQLKIEPNHSAILDLWLCGAIST